MARIVKTYAGLPCAVMCSFVLSISSAKALEGGLGAYLLGGRDTLAGIVPGHGTYITNSFYYIHGKAPTLSIAGLAVAEPRISLVINKLDVAHFFETTILGGTPGIIVSVPYATGRIEAAGGVGRFSGKIRDTNAGFADIAATAVLGWHQGNFHYSAAITVFSPTANYNLAQLTLVPSPGVDNLLNFSKNRYAFVPALSLTYLNRNTGVELSGSLSLELAMKNKATNWKTAPTLNFEAAALQHLPSGIALGVAGYASQQLGEDGGSGADNFKAVVNAKSLQARVFGLGPIITFKSKIGETAVNFKLKYTQEFGTRRRFESNTTSASMGISF